MAVGKGDIGRTGEELAAEHLAKKRYAILERNYATPFGEIDIVAKKDDELIFVEVKTLASDDHGSPFENITYEKTRSVIKNALYYLKRYGKTDHPCRIDAIAVTLDDEGNLKMLEHAENAIELPVGVNYG